MNRISTMALGFFLIFVGAELNVVDRFTMTPRTANFFAADSTLRGEVTTPSVPTEQLANSPYYQASYSATAPARSLVAPSREIVTPHWICWPVLFLGAVVFLHGIGMRRY